MNYIPIRELSALTGVNSVTIRAWERRYGLLKPTRTPKGHRLYCQTDVETIKNVQRHLEQGIAISKIKSIINQSTTVQTDENWSNHGEKLIAMINVLSVNKLENYLHELTGSYTPRILWEYLIQPLDNLLSAKKSDYGIQSKQLLLLSAIQKQAQIFIKSQSNGSDSSVLVVGLDEQFIALESHLIAMQIAECGLKPIMDFYLATSGETPFIVENIKPSAILLHCNGVLTKQFVTRELTGRLGKTGLPIFVTGNSAIINEDLLSEHGIENTANHQELIKMLANRVAGHE